MPEDRRRMYTKRETGTVPKIKHHNMARLNQDEHNVVSNNLGRDSSQPNFLRLLGHPERNLHPTQLMGMDSLIEEHGPVPAQNGIMISTNGSLSTTNTSESVSRRNSIGTVPKCDNVSKYPDKRQIEDKLNQIREYLHITSSLMSNVKNEEDQSTDPAEYEQLEKTYNDLRDSEVKLVALLADIDDYDKSLLEDDQNDEQATENGLENLVVESSAAKNPKNVLEKKVEHANRQLQVLREQENLLLNLQLKAENQLREARHAQQKLVAHQNTNLRHLEDAASDVQVNEFAGGNYKNLNENHDAIWELEDRLKMLKSDLPSSSRQSSSNVQEHFQAQVDCLQQKINQLRDANDNRNQLIHILDNRDSQLQAEHMELQSKLLELQNRKLHVDQLVSQLQNVNEESEEEDVAVQVKKLVSMKQQLSKLKDMLEVVKNTEGVFESQNVKESSEMEAQDNMNSLITKTDNLIQNDVRSNQLTNRSDNISNVRQENNPVHCTNERRVKEKQVNKKSMNANERERLKLQAELQAKKRELEELMCKHKAASSNLNQDVHCENKSEMGATTNSLYEDTTNSWWPISSNIYHLNSSDRYSSDECPEDDMNEYSELNSSGEASNIHLIHPMPALNYQASNYIKRTEAKPHLEVPGDSSCPRAISRSPERSVHNISTVPSAFQRNERGRSNNSEQEAQNKSQIQKQLELIRSVCDSMLEQQNTHSANPQNVRNNLTPSSIYSEPRQFSSPNAHPMNALNIVNSLPESTWLPPPQTVPLNETPNYQNWLATNTLQTQAFMLNTLNQCCQMLWLQQRELAALRGTVSSMQDRLQTNTFDQQTNLASACMNSNPCIYPTLPPQDSHRNSQSRPTNNPKANQVSSATSLPNLNHPHVPQTNSEPAYANQNNMHNARVLESGLNNMIHPHPPVVGDHVNNTVLHSVNHALPSQIWNGQALNNQVAPGNRANNYWDNFRSYSRQNLLSSKSNEGLQNQSASVERSNNSSERSQTLSFLPLSTQKHNTGSGHNDSLNSSDDSTPRRRTVFKPARSMLNTEPVPPDVPNMPDAHSADKMNESSDLLELPLPPMNQSSYSTTSDLNFQSFLNSVSHSESSMSHSNLSDGHACKDCSCNHRNRNEWQPENNLPKSKLFDELRENVYKEVASLISANQGRPHFLIQLFRDLQLVSSDPLRRRTLQSIQTLISHSLVHQGNNAQSTTRQQALNTQSSGMDNDVLVNCPLYFDVSSNLWNHNRSLQVADDNSLDSDCQEHLSEVLTFLNTHSEDVFQQNLLESLKELLVESTFSTLFFHTNVKDGIIQKHFANLVAETLEQYRGKKVQDVRLNILQTIEDLLRGEISLIRLMRENMAENCDLNSIINNEGATATQHNANIPYEQFNSCLLADENVNPPQIQNGDLAEADQSRLELEDEEEEGAVGGVLNILTERNSSNTGQIGQDELQLPKIDFAINAADSEFTEQGLDQVPTRLTTHSRSHSNTPNGGNHFSFCS